MVGKGLIIGGVGKGLIIRGVGKGLIIGGVGKGLIIVGSGGEGFNYKGEEFNCSREWWGRA